MIESALDISVNSIRYTPGTDYKKTGNSFTGSGFDYLRIGVLFGEEENAFANMDWAVHYYNDTPD